MESSYKLLVSYAGASYVTPYPDRLITEIKGVSGTGGYFNAAAPVSAIVSLGFDSGAALTVIDKIEPDSVIAVITASKNKTVEKGVKDLNREFIESAERTIYLPHMSFSLAYAGLSELISSIKNSNILCVPLGPKTHVIGFALAGLIYPHASSLHVVSRYSSPFRAKATGEICVAGIQFVHEAQREPEFA